MGKQLHPLLNVGWNYFSIPFWEWISKFIPHFAGHVIIYPWVELQNLAWLSNYPRLKQCGVIIHPCDNYNGGLVKPSSKSGMGE